MIRATAIAQTILLASTTIVLAQGGNTQPAPQGAPPPQVLGQTGTMYDGNNVHLQVPPEPNEYWSRVFAGYSPTGDSGPAAASATTSPTTSAGK
jgi:hypothetical protein